MFDDIETPTEPIDSLEPIAPVEHIKAKITTTTSKAHDKQQSIKDELNVLNSISNKSAEQKKVINKLRAHLRYYALKGKNTEPIDPLGPIAPVEPPTEPIDSLEPIVPVEYLKGKITKAKEHDNKQQTIEEELNLLTRISNKSPEDKKLINKLRAHLRYYLKLNPLYNKIIV